MGTALRNPGQLVSFPCGSIVSEGAVLVQDPSNDDRVILPAAVPVVGGILGLAKTATTATGQNVDVVLNGFFAGIAGAAIGRGNPLVTNSTLGDLRPYNAATDVAAQIVGQATETVNSGDRVGVLVDPGIYPSGVLYFGQAGALHSVRGVVLSNVATLSAFASVTGGTIVDGVTYAAGDRVLLAGQTTASQNGIYVVGVVAAGTAPLTRAADFPTGATLPAETLVSVSEGTTQAHSLFRLLSQGSALVIDTSSLSFAKMLDAGSAGLKARCVGIANFAVGTGGLATAMDGVTVVAGDYVLLVAQTTASQNGLYIAGAGAWSLAPEWAQGQIKAGQVVEVGPEGTAFPNSSWKVTATPVSTGGYITIGTTNPALYPRMQKGVGAIGTVVTTGWILSTSSAVSAIDQTAAAAIKAVLVAGAGTGTITWTGTGTDAVLWAIHNW